jgi:hypothetical protein
VSNDAILFREAFESFDPTAPGTRWSLTRDPGDLVFVDGNTAGASYLVISKSPLAAGTQTEVETTSFFDIPVDIAVGLSMSQNTLGQELSVELIDPDAPLADVDDIDIASISQTTTTLTIDTVLPHRLVVGKAVGVFGCSDSRANYPALVVASIPTPTQFTCTAGPGGTIPSLTITNPAGAKGRVFFRERFGRAKNGVAQIFENASATQASLYVRSEAGNSLPSGAIAGQHSVTVGTRASVQPVSLKDTFVFSPSTEYRFIVSADRVQWSDAPVDTSAQASSRLVRSQIAPSKSSRYRLRFRANNSKSLTVPAAQIVSAAKTGTTTATFITADPHGLALGDLVTIYGVRNQTDFPNVTAATAVASIVNANTFTVVVGATTPTITSYGGYVARVDGGNLPSALGANVVVAQSAVLVTRVDGTRELTLTGNASWSSLSIGDMVEVVGLRVDGTGAPVGVDGAWKVANVNAAALALVLPFNGQRSVIADFGSVNCGGAVIKRTCTRISFVRVVDMSQRVELTPRPSGDSAAAVPTTIQNTVATTLASTAVAGTVANDGVAGNPVTTGGVARSANPTAVNAAGDAVNDLATMIGVKVTKPYAIPEAEWANTLALTTTADVAVQTAAGLGLKRHLTMIEMTNTGASAVDVIVKDGTTVRLQFTMLPTSSRYVPLPTGIPTTANTALNVALSAAGTVRVNALGYTAP